MKNDSVINQIQFEKSIEKPLEVIAKENREDRYDSWFVEKVISDVCLDISRKYDITLSAAELMLLGGGYNVYTTMNTGVQETLEKYFEDINNFPTEVKSGLNYAMVVTDSKSGNLLGLIGRVGQKMGNKLLNHALVTHIPGSALKPIALYAPLIDNKKINWATVFDDVPVNFISEGEGYREYPRNSPAVYDGLTTISDGLCYSKNTLAVRLCNIIGAKNVFNNLRNNFGFDTLVESKDTITDIATAPMALGQLSRGVSLLKLTESYSVFPGEGVFHEAISYYKVADHNNKIILDKTPSEKRVFKESTSKIMNQMLMRVCDNGTARVITLKDRVNTAGKTGTSGGSKEKISRCS
jgi:penicillin-binding protein 1A